MYKLFFTSLISLLGCSAIAQSVIIDAPAAADTALSVRNNGTGPVGSFITNNPNNTGALIYGDHFGKGAGIKMRMMNAQNINPGISIFQSGNGSGIFSSSNKSKAGEFYSNAGNTDTTVYIKQDGTGMALSVDINNLTSPANVANFYTKGTGTVIDALQANSNTNTNAMNVTSTGLGYVATFNSWNTNSTSSVVKLNNLSQAPALDINMVNSTSQAEAVKIYQPGIGSGISIQIPNAVNGARGINVEQSGVGPGVYATAMGGNAVWGITSSVSAAGVIGDNTFGEAVVGRNRGGMGVGAVVGRNDSSGCGVRGFNTKNGIAVLGQAGISGGTGNSGVFENVNTANSTDVLVGRSNGTGTILSIDAYSPTGPQNVVKINTNGTGNLAVFQTDAVNKVRIDNGGKGYFNGGMQSSGADMAEAFDVEDELRGYEPGDVLIISAVKDRTVVKSNGAYSSLVAGVYATKPGVLMSEENIETDLSDKLPMGVVGVIPTKVCLEGGEIKRGDMLVTSSLAGVAMKADPAKVKLGQVIGKALENYNATGTGKIRVLVNVK